MCKRMGIAKRAFAILLSLGLVLCLCLCRPIKAQAMAVPAPILPYVPPNMGTMLDYLFNLNGLTAPNITGEENKIQAYMDLYKRALGVGWQSAWDALAQSVNDGKTSGKMEIGGGALSALTTAFASALQDGVPVGEMMPPTTNGQTLLDRLRSYGFEWSLDNANFAWERLSQQSATIKWVAYTGSRIVLLSWSPNTYSGVPKIQDLGNGRFRVVKQDDSFINPQIMADLTVNNGVIQDVSYSNFAVGVGTFSWGVLPSALHELTASEGNMASVQAQSSTIGSGIIAGTIRALCAYTVLNADGTIDETKPMVVPVPVIDIVPAVTVDGLTGVQEDAGAVPVSLDVDVASIQDEMIASVGGVPEYSIDLTQYFPFCIPFDIGNLLTKFIADPVAPVIEFAFPVGYESGTGVILQNFSMDLSVLDSVAFWVRKGLVMIFIVGLAMGTREIFLRG